MHLHTGGDERALHLRHSRIRSGARGRLGKTHLSASHGLLVCVDV